MQAQSGRDSNRRRSESFIFELESLRFTATVSRFGDGSSSELFLLNHKHDDQVDANVRDSATCIVGSNMSQASNEFAKRCAAAATVELSVRSVPRSIGWVDLKE
jgi:hypothetical protein